MKDAIIVGGGMGGYSCAVRLAGAGKSVVLIEKQDVGGTCINRGCIPTKLLFQAALLFQQAKRNSIFGIEHEATRINYTVLSGRKNEIVSSTRRSIEAILKNFNIKLLRGAASILDENTVNIETDRKSERIHAKNIVIATGSRPIKLEELGGPKLERAIFSDDVLDLSEIPEQMTIVGGGVLGVEFAYIYRLLGSRVNLIEKEKQLLPEMDEDVAREVELALREYGVEIYTQAFIDGPNDVSSNYIAVKHQGVDKQIEAAMLVCTLGRAPLCSGAGLDALPLGHSSGFIPTDLFLRTDIPNIYAVGDVNGQLMQASCARQEGIVAAENILGMNRAIDYRSVPHNVFLHPEVASVGLTEKESLSCGLEIQVVKEPYFKASKSLIEGERRGFIKFVIDAHSKKILGAHIVGYRASELIGESVLAVSQGMTTDGLFRVPRSHPSLSEIYPDATSQSSTRSIIEEPRTEEKSPQRFSESIREALRSAMLNDETVILLGEDICDPFGGAFKVTKGLSSQFPHRVLNTPMSESALAGVIAGMALRGLKPVLEIMFGDFVTLCVDQIVNHGSKFRWMYNDLVRVPYVIRTPMGGRRGYGPTHSQTLEKLFLGIPGLKVIAPSHLHDPGELLKSSIEDEDPVLFIENKMLYSQWLKYSQDGYIEEFRFSSTGERFPTIRLLADDPAELDVTVVAYGGMAPLVMEAAKEVLLREEIACEIIIPSSLQPFDKRPVLDSVRVTKRLVIAEESTPMCGFSAEIAALVAETPAVHSLKAPIRRVASKRLPLGCAATIEESILPSKEDIIKAIRELCEKQPL